MDDDHARSDFRKLWVGQAISTIGSGVTASALPLTAVLMLGARAGDMGWLLAVESAPVLLVGMFAGVWVAAGGITLGALWLARSGCND